MVKNDSKKSSSFVNLNQRQTLYYVDEIKFHLRSLLPSPVDVETDSGEDDDDNEEDGDDDGRRRRSSGRWHASNLVLAVPAAVVDLAVARRVVQAHATVLAFAHQRQGFRLFSC